MILKKFKYFLNKYAVLLLFLLFVLVHLKYIRNGFIWLDHNDIEQKFALVPVKDLIKAFTLPFGQTSFYRPVVVIANSIDNALFSGWPEGFHITNLVVYGLFIISSLRFLKLFFGIKKSYLYLAALLFIVHPAGLPIKAMINFRQESLLALFTLESLNFYINWTKTGDKKLMLLSLLFFVLALLTKETALVLIPLSVITIGLRELSGKGIRNFIKKNLFYLSGSLILITAYLLMRFYVIQHFWGTKMPELTTGQQIDMRLLLIWKMFLNLVSPAEPGLSDALKIHDLSALQISILAIITALTFIFLLKRTFIRRHVKAFALLAVFILPGMAFIPVPRIGSPHYSFLVLIPFIGILTVYLQDLKIKSLKSAAIILFTVWSLAAAYTTFVSASEFKNDLSFFSTESNKDPDFSEAYYYLGNYYLRSGDFRKAADYFSKSLEEKPGVISFKDRDSYSMNLATSYMQSDQIDKAREIYERLLKTGSGQFKPYVLFNLALIAQQKNDYPKVITLLENSNWDFPEAYLLLAQAYQQQYSTNKEIEYLKKAYEIASPDQKYQIGIYLKNIEGN